MTPTSAGPSLKGAGTISGRASAPTTIFVLLVAGAVSACSQSPGGAQSQGTGQTASGGQPESGTVFKTAAKELIRQRLRDPASAEFSEMVVMPAGGRRPTIVCGKVNAKNGFGGMTGVKRFVVGGTVATEEDLGEADMDTLWRTFC